MEAKDTRRSGGVIHTVRSADGRFKRLKLTRKQAVEAQCVECLGFAENPSNCTSPNCPLYPFRKGTRLTQVGNMDDPTGGEGSS